MSVTFGNPLGFWALAGIPAILVIHFLQQRSRTLRISTLFLLEALVPESRGGRSWQKLRSSWSLWLQIAAVLLAAWLLAAPRWMLAQSAQTVIAVLDCSASMTPFRAEAVAAVEKQFGAVRGRAAHTEWLVLETDETRGPLYRGPDLAQAVKSLKEWRTGRGVHDPGPALRLAQTLAGANGMTFFVTDRREKVPAAQAAIGVGRPLQNVGFAGGTVATLEKATQWRVLVRNYTDLPQRRRWALSLQGQRGPEQDLEVGPGALIELSGEYPPAAECALHLEGDAFALDDSFPMVRPRAKRLEVAAELEAPADDFFRRALLGVDGAVEVPRGQARLVATSVAPAVGKVQATIIVPNSQAAEGKAAILRAPVTAARHPLVEELTWQGWLGTGAGSRAPAGTDTVLLWHNEKPLVWAGVDAVGGRQLILNFDWRNSNASRLPSAVILVQRFAQEVRDALAGPYAANFDAQSPVPVAEADSLAGGTLALEFRPSTAGEIAARRILAPRDVATLRAPSTPGHFLLKRGEVELVAGAAQFADTRQADFRAAETFALGLDDTREASLLRNTRPDPWVPLWLLLLGAALLGSWWTTGRKVPT